MPKGKGYPPRFTAKDDEAPKGKSGEPGVPAVSPRKGFRSKRKKKGKA